MATGAIDPATGKPFKDKRAVRCQVQGCTETALFEEYKRYLCSRHSLAADKIDHRRKSRRSAAVVLLGLRET